MIGTLNRHATNAKKPLSHAIVLATPTKAMFMKSKFEKLALHFGLLLTLGCGARSTLDTLDEEPIVATGGVGGVLGSGGQPGTGGIHGSGGRPGTGGIPNVGGTVGGFGGMGPGGSSMGGSKGGAGGSGLGGQAGGSKGGAGGSGLGGQAGGSKGGAGGSGLGGQAGGSKGGAGGSGLGGQVGGSRGGAGGSLATGGRIGAGGSTGGSAGAIGPDAGFGGSGGAIGRDGGLDVRTGGAGGNADSGADGSTCPGLASNEELIDDLNDGDRFIPSVNGRAGAWSDSHDDSPNAKMYPDPNTGFAPTDTGDPCRKYAAYVAGGGYVLWGANVWFGLGSPYDASKYKGISFWAKVDAGTSSVVRVAFPDKDTQPDGNICQPGVSTGPTACYDHYGYRVTLDSTWTKYTVMFSQLAQEGGGQAGTAFDPSSLYQVLFQIPVGANFGIWIDDVAFTF